MQITHFFNCFFTKCWCSDLSKLKLRSYNLTNQRFMVLEQISVICWSFRIHFGLRLQEAQQRFRLLTAEELFLGSLKGQGDGCHLQGGARQSTTSSIAAWRDTILHRCYRKPRSILQFLALLAFILNNEESSGPGGQAVIGHAPPSLIYQTGRLPRLSSHRLLVKVNIMHIMQCTHTMTQ